MKVLSKGTEKSKWSKKVVCTGEGNSCDNARKGILACGAKLEIDARDVFVTEHTFIDGTTDTYYTYKCPECGALTDIDETNLPSDVMEYALHKHQNNNDREM